MSQLFNVAIVGATGLVGRTMLTLLEQRAFPIKQLYLLASNRSVGEPLRFGKKNLSVEDVADFDFKKVELALFTAGAAVSAQYIPAATKEGCMCIDNTSHFRYDSDVPLVIPEVNRDALTNCYTRKIIANPNCSTIQLMVVLKPIYDKVGISRINVVTYQSVSGAGRSAVSELFEQSRCLLNGLNIKPPKAMAAQVAFNVIPHIDEFQENGYTREEMKIVWETKKLLADESIRVNATAVRVPVFYSHAEAVQIETKHKIGLTQLRSLLQKAPGVTILDKPRKGGYPTPILCAIEKYKDTVLVGRIREDLSHPLGFNLWIVSDNIRKGAALNAVQIAEELVNQAYL